MSLDHNNIYSIVERLRILEEGLDKDQKSVNQLGPTFKPKTVAVLTAKTDPKNPMAGKLVGGAEESIAREDSVLESDMVEDVLEKVEKSFKDFLKKAEEQIKDSDIKEKKKEDTDLKNKDQKDRTLIIKALPMAEDPTEQEPTTTIAPITTPQAPIKNPTYAESSPVKSIAVDDDMICEIHGNELDGFEIRRGHRSLPTRFKNIEQAELALEMFQARRRMADEAQDYLDEE